MPFLFLGLGNPGPKYERTRHNAGIAALDELLSRHGARLTSHRKTNTDVAEFFLGTEKIIAARPRSFMNLSGGPAHALAQFFRVPPERIVVAYDDMERDFGAVHLARGGGDHGHNGLRSITKVLKTKEYYRLSLGVGRPPGRMDPARFVLKPFSKAEHQELPIMAADAVDAFESLVAESIR